MNIKYYMKVSEHIWNIFPGLFFFLWHFETNLKDGDFYVYFKNEVYTFFY